MSAGSEWPSCRSDKGDKEAIGTSDVSLMATRYFGGRYFSFRQAVFIDSVLNESKGETYLAALLALPAQSSIPLASSSPSQWSLRRKDGTIKTHLIRQISPVTVVKMRARRFRLAGSLSQHHARPTASRNARRLPRSSSAQKGVAVIYADPPYTRDHYSRFYHVLETLCLRDCPMFQQHSWPVRPVAGCTEPIGTNHLSASSHKHRRHSKSFLRERRDYPCCSLTHPL